MLMFFRFVFAFFIIANTKAVYSKDIEKSKVDETRGSRHSFNLTYGAIEHKGTINEVYFNGKRSEGYRIAASWFYQFFMSSRFKQNFVLGVDYIQMEVMESYQDSALTFRRRLNNIKFGWDIRIPILFGIDFSFQPGIYNKWTNKSELQSKVGRKNLKLHEDRAIFNYYHQAGIGYQINKNSRVSVEYSKYFNAGSSFALGAYYEL